MAAQRAARGASDEPIDTGTLIDTDATERLLADMHDAALSVPGGDGAAAPGGGSCRLPKRRRIGCFGRKASEFQHREGE